MLFGKTSLHRALYSFLSLAFLAGCGARNEISDKNLVQAGDPTTNQVIMAKSERFQVLGSSAAKELSASSRASLDRLKSLASTAQTTLKSRALPRNSALDDGESLIFAMDIASLGQERIFGGVITQVSDKEKENLGQLKLTDLTPIHVSTLIASIAGEEETFVLLLRGCVQSCDANSVKLDLLTIPIVGVDETEEKILIDLAALGAELNLVSLLDPNGEFTELITQSSATTSVDYSNSTLVFDVRADMVPKGTLPTQPNPPITTITTRWYLRDAGLGTPNFVSRAATDGVGFFMTERAKDSVIQRFGTLPVKYYVKNVPEQFKAAFLEAFDDWNTTFKALLGKDVFTVEFIDQDDPRAPLLVTGDIRYNILEWDLHNAAPYGGLGPSIAHQLTGEILSANVLVQGPTIVDIYSNWFEVTTEARTLRIAGRHREADALLAKTQQQIVAKLDVPKTRYELTLGNLLNFRVPAQLPTFNDPIMRDLVFDAVPEGVDYETYMHGYFMELVAHELGHNVGLRHNFRGNLSHSGLEEGKVSHSVMEYLGKGFRHLNRINTYDQMAIDYGYAGTMPVQTDLYCTDENVAGVGNLGNSPECSRDDATEDPFSFFETRLDRALSLLVLPGSVETPIFSAKDMDRDLTSTLGGLGLYAYTVSLKDTWTNFFKENRPTTEDGIKDLVLNSIKDRLCSPVLAEALAEKVTEEARTKTEENIAALRQKALELLLPMDMFSAEQLSCS